MRAASSGRATPGARVAQGDIVVLIDDDTEAQPDWVQTLAACFEDPNVVGVTGALIPNWAGEEPRWFPAEFYWVFGCSYTGLPAGSPRSATRSAPTWRCEAQALREIGGFQQGVAPREIPLPRASSSPAGNARTTPSSAIRVRRRWPEMSWLYQPQATVRHAVAPEQATLGYLVRRSFEEGAGKARLARVRGPRTGLSSERRYVSVVLPRGMARGIWQPLRGDRHGVLRSAASRSAC